MRILQEQLDDSPDSPKMIACSAVMQTVFEEIYRTAQADATVLVSGESGTGKELVAEAIHRHSRRRDGPFVAINMAAIPETLVESELFGHVEGAFTGAATPRAGRFEAADGGTLFIDEIGDLKLTSQSKLLRVLENHCVTPVGSNENRKVDVRVIAATNRNLETLIAEGKFREDLYYRLTVVTIALPPLRNRREDIPLLVDHFLDELCRSNGKPRLSADPELIGFLESYDWPGNVRQLRNCLESMVILSRSTMLSVNDLPAMIRNYQRNPMPYFEMPQGVTLADVVKAAVLQTLDRLDGNRTQAAQSLGISVRTLQRKLKQWQHANVAGNDPKTLETLSTS
ncbi:MAG: sigma-54 dependent transcriptional regulator [Thermoguttaceae bacterium]|jgi:DNA-binding NtrC family response regulator